jgi:hypothetical protein
MPPMPTDEDAPPLMEETTPHPVAGSAPAGFWTDLSAAVKQELKPPLNGFFGASESESLSCRVEESRVVLLCSPFILKLLDKPDVLELVARKASAILGRPVTARAVDASDKPVANAQRERLMQFGREHSNIVTIKE